MTIEDRDCKLCNGTGVRTILGETHVCRACGGSGRRPAPDEAGLEEACRGRGGRLRSTRPRDDRAYYVWRMARVRAGVDERIPVLAALLVYGDPFRPELDALAERLAVAHLGGA